MMRKNGPEKVLLDWKAYFDAFCEAHGGHPIKHFGRLLFCDGWRYALDHRGPEWAPPDDPYEAALLRHAYWHFSRRRIAEKIFHLREGILNLEELQRSKSLPLRAVVWAWDSDERKLVNNRDDSGQARELDMTGPRIDLEAHEDGLRDAEQNLRELEREFPALKGVQHAVAAE